MDWKEERSLTSSKKSKFRQAYLPLRVYIGTMNRLQALAVDRMQEFMILHHGEDVTVAQVLALSNYSPFHASRLFTEATGYSVGEYLRKLRENHHGFVNCSDLLRINREEGGNKKDHCDGMVYEAVELAYDILKKKNLI